MIDLKNKTVLFADMDGTLITTASGKTFPEDCADFRIRLDVLNDIVIKMPNLQYLFIVTNQAGIPQYMTKDDFIAKINAISTFLNDYLNPKGGDDIAIDYEFCLANNASDNNRKPNVGMLESLCDNWLINPDNKTDMLMIGDASGKKEDFSDSDKKTAENFDIDYIDVEEFLKLKN